MGYYLYYGDDWERRTINGRLWLIKNGDGLIICKQISENGLGIDRTAYAPLGMSAEELQNYLK